MSTLKDKDGNPIEYTKDNYDMQTQTNVPRDEPVNFYDYNARVKKKEVVGKNISVPEYLTVAPGNWEGEDQWLGGIKDYSEIIQGRIDNQSDISRAVNSVTMGVVGALGTALKDIGYMTSPQSYTNYVGWHDTDNFNWVSRALIKSGDFFEAGSESWAPIYEHGGDTVKEQIFRWGTTKGVLQSSLGFLVPGLAASKAATIGSKLVVGSGKLLQYTGKLSSISQLDKVGVKLARANEALKTIQLAFPEVSKKAGVLGATYIQSTGEAVWEAVDAHDAIMKDLAYGINMGRVDPFEAMKIANEAAQKTFTMNMAKGALNLSIMSQFVPGGSKKLIEAGLMHEAKDFLTEAPLEGIEEGSQNIFKKEATYQAISNYAKGNKDSQIIKELTASGMYDVNSPTNTTLRIMQYAQITDVITDAIIGTISGPVQKGMANMLQGNITPGSAYRSKMKAYREQQAEIKEMTDLIGDDAAMKAKVGGSKAPTFQSKAAPDDLSADVAKAEAAKNLYDAVKDDPQLEELAREQVFSSIIAESVSKGIFPALLAEAEKLKGTDSFSNTLYDYAIKTQKKYSKVERLLNAPQVLNAINKVEVREKYLNVLNQRRDALDLSDDPGGLVARNYQDYTKSIEYVESSIKEQKKEIAKLSSISTQYSLFNEQQKEREVEAAVLTLPKVKTAKELHRLAKMHPGLSSTTEYATAKNRIKLETPTRTAKTDEAASQDPKTSTVSNEVQEETSTNGVNESNGVTSSGAKGSPSSTAMKGITDGYIESSLTALIPEGLTEVELVKAKADIRKASDNFLPNVTSKEQYEEGMDKIIKNVAAGIAATREKSSPNGKAMAEEVKRTVRQYGEKVSPGKLPEEAMEEIIDVIAQIKAKELQQTAIAEDKTISQEKKDSLLKEVATEITLLSTKTLPQAKARFTRAASAEAKHNQASANPMKTNTRGKSWGEVKTNFKLYMDYLTDIMGEEFVKTNYGLIKSLYRGDPATKSTILPDTYADYRVPLVYDPDYQDNTSLDKAQELKQSQLQRKQSDLEDGVRLLFIVNPADSLAHKSESGEPGVNPDGTPNIFSDTVPKHDISPVVIPENYNGGEEISFEIDTAYRGPIKLVNTAEEELTVFWEVLMPYVFSIVPSSGNPGVINPNAVADIKQALGIDIVGDVADIIPIKVLGTQGELLGYMHNPSWISTRTSEAELVEDKRNKLRDNRRHAIEAGLAGTVAKGQIRGKIITKSIDGSFYRGFVLSYGLGWIPTEEGIPDKDIVIGTVSNTGITMPNPTINQSQILNLDEVTDSYLGMPVALIPIGKVNGIMKYHAEVLIPQTLSTDTKATVKDILRVFLTADKESDAYKFYWKYGYDITTVEGARAALTTFINVYDEHKHKEMTVAFEAYIQDTFGETGKIALRDNKDGTRTILFGTKTANTVSSKDISGTTTLPELLKTLNDLIDDDYLRFNIDNIHLKASESSGKKIPIPERDKSGKLVKIQKTYKEYVKGNTNTVMRGIPAGNGKHVYAFQHIVEFNIKSFTPVPPEYRKEAIPSGKSVKTSVPALSDEEILKLVASDSSASAIQAVLELSSILAKELSDLLAGATKGVDNTIAIHAILEKSPVYKDSHPISESPEYAALDEKYRKILLEIYANEEAFTLSISSKVYTSMKGDVGKFKHVLDSMFAKMNKENATFESRRIC